MFAITARGLGQISRGKRQVSRSTMRLLPGGYGTVSLGAGVQVQPLGFGTWSWGNKVLWGYDESLDGELQYAFERAIEPSGPLGLGGGRYFFDTGDSYGTGELEGRAEALLGRFRSETRVPRRAVIGTKLAVYPNRLSGGSFEAACRASLDRMGRDRMELVQAHWPAVKFQPWQEGALWDGLARCYEAGLADAVGTSNYGPVQLRKIAAYMKERGVPLVSNQVQFSLLSMEPLDSGLFDACAELGISPIGYSPLALGLLTDRYDVSAGGDGSRLPDGPRGLLFAPPRRAAVAAAGFHPGPADH